MKNIEINKLKYITLIAVFVIAVVVTYAVENYNGRASQYLAMEEATYPVITMETGEGVRYNSLHGYAYEMDIRQMNSVITPLPSDKKLNTVIASYGEEITGISYKVMDILTGELIEETEVKGYTVKNYEVEAVLNIKNLVENGEEYMLEVCLTTSEHEKIFYYTRIVAGAYSGVSEKLNFALEFNGYIYDKAKLNNIAKWLEPSSGADNTNFGYANINSSLAHIGWGDLNPTVESAIIPDINEISGETASITLNYVIAMPADDGTYFSCKVEEFYRVRITSRDRYLLNFERNTDAIFSSSNDVNPSRITLGIRSELDAHTENTSDGKFIYFASDGNLWCYNQEQQEFTKIFSFGAQDVDGVRENYDRHKIQIIKVEENGNVRFAVYGYMNRGTHEGCVGAGIYYYDAKSSQVTENLFVPVKVPYEVLRENIGELFYVNDYNVCYFILGNTLYSVDLTSMEYMEEAKNLTEGMYAVSRDQSIIAYPNQEEGREYASISVFNMGQGGKYVIEAPQGQFVRVFDFIDSDLFYGYVNQSDVYRRVDGELVLPAYRMEVMDREHNLIKTYEQENVYIERTQVSGMRLNIYRLQKSQEGFVSTSMDQLLNKDENTVDEVMNVGTIVTDKWKKEVVLNIKKTYAATDKIIVKAAEEIFFSEDVMLSFNWQEDERLTYYAYGNGRLQGEYDNPGQAIQKANETVGYVAGSDGKIYWRRLKSNSAKVKQLTYEYHTNSLCSCLITLLRKGGYAWDISGVTTGERTAVNVIDDATGGRSLNLCMADVDTVLYYIDNQIPVIGRINTGSYVLIIGYNSEEIVYYDYDRAAEVTVSYRDAAALFEGWNNTFFAYWK